MLRLVRAVDALYESVIIDPESWTDERFAEWSADLIADGEPPGRETLRQLRAAIRNARKLIRYWAGSEPPDDWAMAVDQALGGAGWDPSLRLAMLSLEATADEDSFDEVRSRFRMVNSTPWLEGISYSQWLEMASR